MWVMKTNDNMSRLNVLLSLLLMKIHYFWSGEIMITTKCSAGCRHCVYAHVKKEDMPIKIVADGMSLLRDLGIRRVLITGGEPFESYETLVYTLEKALTFLPPENIALITSGSWAKTRETVERRIDPLVSMGLKKISISIDAFHLENIDPNNYFLILNYLKKKHVTPVILIRYNTKINMHRSLLERIKNNYDVMIITDIIVRTGGAASLPINETKADPRDLKEFQNTFDSKLPYVAENPIDHVVKSLISKYIRSTCIYPTLFPNGDFHLCCRKNENTKICNLSTDNINDFYESLKKFNDNFTNNVRRVLSQPLDCNNCPISKY